MRLGTIELIFDVETDVVAAKSNMGGNAIRRKKTFL